MLSEPEILALLRSKHRPPEWVFVPHVPNGTGALRARTIDALAMNMYPSRGLELVGYEIKRSRSDFLTEMRDPGKAEALASYCTRFAIVAGGKDICKPAELPQGWGLYIVNSKDTGLLTKKKPPVREHIVPLDRPLMAAMLRAAAGHQPELLNQEYQRGRQDGASSVKRTNARELEQATGRLERLKDTIDGFEEAAGVSLNQYSSGDIGRIVAALREPGNRRNLAGMLERSRNGLSAVVERLDGALEQLEEVEVPSAPE